MAAKYKGKKNGLQGYPSGRKASSAQSKKGVNNYYLHMPHQHDIEQHFKAVNPQSISLQDYTHSIQKVPPTTGKELGRVQSNFIGTEFQIFSPKTDNRSNLCNKVNNSIGGSGTMNLSNESTDELDGVTHMSSGGYNKQSSDSITGRNISETGAHKKRGLRRLRKSRLRRKKSNGDASHANAPDGDGNSNQAQQETENVENETVPPSTRRISKMKSSWLRSRRVIANSTTELSDTGSYQNMASQEVEIGAITYTANLLGNRPRIMDVCIPNVNSSKWRDYCENFDSDRWETTELEETIEEERSMLNKLKHLQLVAEQQLVQNQIGGTLNADEGNPAETIDSTPDFGLLSLQNRPPWWNVELGAFVLNFGGRVSVASVKNFQLCDRHNHDDSMLQFGRIEGRHSFTMDYSYPLSAVQAFAIAISSLQSKISFG